MSQTHIPAASALVKGLFGQAPLRVTPIGGGFYAKVYLAEISGPPYRTAVKIYDKPGLNRSEFCQIETMRRYAALRLPVLYACHDADGEIPVHALAMEFLEGKNAGHAQNLPAAHRRRIADSVVDNLMALHSAVNSAGFGPVGGACYAPNWQDYYRTQAQSILNKAIALEGRGALDGHVVDIMRRALDGYGQIFSDSVKARLIHGDYNMWNILLNDGQTDAAAFLDPFGGGWADAELDLYQLDNANGKEFGLLDNYRARAALSPAFDVKKCFYELFTEVMHYHDAGVDVAGSQIPGQARALLCQMARYRIG
ncbi:MAG: phosphotransferase [Eubacteriales bacterium]|nr:phosphotransferase [Eubacteriales bacterium]